MGFPPPSKTPCTIPWIMGADFFLSKKALWSVKKGLVDLEDFSSFVKRRRDRRFQKIPINREWNPKLLIWQNSIEGKVDCWYEN